MINLSLAWVDPTNGMHADRLAGWSVRLSTPRESVATKSSEVLHTAALAPGG